MRDVCDVRDSGESLARQDEALAGSNVEESLRGQHETWGDETAVENGNRPSGGVDAFQDVETNERRETISALVSSRETRERAAAAADAAVIDRSSSNTLGSGSFDALDEIKSDDDDDDGGWNDPGVGYRAERPWDGGGGGEGTTPPTTRKTRFSRGSRRSEPEWILAMRKRRLETALTAKRTQTTRRNRAGRLRPRLRTNRTKMASGEPRDRTASSEYIL